MSGFHSVRNHNIYLSTINRDPEENRYSMVFPVPNDIIFLDDVSSQRMKISLMTFGLNANWTEINSTNNQVSFNIDGNVVPITIPAGNYPFYNLAAYITNSQDYIACEWDMPSNTFIFSNSTDSSMLIDFTNNSYQVLGFSATDSGMTGTTITSTSPIVPRQNTELYIKLMNVILGAENLSLDNYADGILKPSNLLSIIPITCSPFQNMFYDNSVYGQESGVFISNEKLNQICIDIVDKQGASATFIPDWTASLKIEILSIEDEDLECMKESLVEISQTLNRLLMLKIIG